MIAGVGTDIASIQRIENLYRRYGCRVVGKILSLNEFEAFERATEPARFLAKRFAAKEAFGKALGIGVATPATMPNITVAHDELGKPVFEYAVDLVRYLDERGLIAHLSISDEREFAVAFVVMEKINGR